MRAATTRSACSSTSGTSGTARPPPPTRSASIDRIAGVHICDVRSETRGWADRVLPGDGIADVAALIGALDAAGWDGLYDLEIFSDDGTFGTAYPDSLWDIPAADLARQGRTALLAAWQGRRMLVPARSDPQRKEAA